MLKTRWFFMESPVATGVPPFGDLWSGRCLLVTGGGGLTDTPVSPVLHLQLHPGLHRLLCLPADEPGAEGRAADRGLGGLPGPLQRLPELAVGLLWPQPGQPHRDQWHPQVRPHPSLQAPCPLPVLTVAHCSALCLVSVLFQTRLLLHPQSPVDRTACGLDWQVAWFPLYRRGSHGPGSAALRTECDSSAGGVSPVPRGHLVLLSLGQSGVGGGGCSPQPSARL